MSVTNKWTKTFSPLSLRLLCFPILQNEREHVFPLKTKYRSFISLLFIIILKTDKYFFHPGTTINIKRKRVFAVKQFSKVQSRKKAKGEFAKVKMYGTRKYVSRLKKTVLYNFYRMDIFCIKKNLK